MGAHIEIDLRTLQDFSELLKKAPKTLYRELAKAYQSIGRYDIDRIRGNVSGSLKLVSKGAANSFKYKASDAGKVDAIDKLFTSEYTGWKAAEIFQTGGTIAGKGGKYLTIITPQGRRATGKRSFTQSQIRAMITNKTARFIPTPHGILLVQFTKGGKLSKKAGKFVILAIMKKKVVEKKRIDFYETSESGNSMHQEFMEYAIENTLAEIAAGES